jgi:hypothetical protein
MRRTWTKAAGYLKSAADPELHPGQQRLEQVYTSLGEVHRLAEAWATSSGCWET